MDSPRDDDPFHWDVATVVSVLTAPHNPWVSNPSALAVQIQQEEIDGATLLKFEHICSRQELMECLGIRLARHKVALGEELFTLKSRSRAYQQWKQDFNNRQSSFSIEFDGPKKSPSLSFAHPSGLPAAQAVETVSHLTSQPAPGQEQTLADSEAAKSTSGPAPKADDSLQNGSSKNESETLSPKEAVPLVAPQSFSPPQVSDAADVNAHQSEDERPVKRKRIAPVTLTTKPHNIAPAFIPTEADTVSAAHVHEQTGQSELPWEEAVPGAYLGDGSLTIEMIKSPTRALSSRLVEPSKNSFASTVPNWLPPGRRLTVNRGMKQLLRKNSYREMLRRQGFVSIRSPSPADTDPVLDLVDLPDAFDEETLREIEEERQEREIHEALAAQFSLTPQRIGEILNDAIEAMSAAWREKKLPKHLKKAYRLWHDARRRGTKKHQVLAAHRHAKFYDDRVKKLCAEIVGETWNKESDLKNQANCLEQSIQDKLYNGWLAEMLESRVEPPKPQTVPRPKLPNSKQPENSFGEEILTSSDEEDFIVSDEVPALTYENQKMEVDEDLHDAAPTSSLPVKGESPEYVDLTHAAWGPSSFIGPKTQSFVDLTSAADSNPDPTEATQSTNRAKDVLSKLPPEISPPLPEDFEGFEEIGAKGSSSWYKCKDRWRLLISLVWQLPHARRGPLLHFLQTKTCDDAWEDGIQAHVSEPIESIDELGHQPTKTIAFDLTRIFLCFVRIKNYGEGDPFLLSFSARWKRKFADPDNRQWFFLLWSFLNDVAHKFPQDSQIYRPETFDDDIEDDLDEDLILEEEEQSQSKPQRAAKEIIQDKDAVDLREREKLRVEEQQARRDKLRKNLALLGTVPRDRARLIVNESKQEEDQPLIYINQDIGNRIKDHQLEGVRFMWNQIVLDSETRQGCLLAHTMGLGKTMQVITLLVVIQEAATSADPGVKAQIPEDLRHSQTVVVCPATLVDNWIDELLMWAPDGILGEFRRIDAQTPPEDRPETIRQWANDGGVLVIGYPMLSKMVSEPQVGDLLLDKANIVVADEAHQMKNPTSQANMSCSRFRTKSRIALTGSPLANNVEEYRTMIDWVAPNFLGPLAEFRDIYARPIQHGLWRNSTGAEKRTALKKLEALKVTVAPKVNRATIKTCLNDDLPAKYEFVIFVPPTPLQSRLYDIYLNAVGRDQKLAKSRILAISNDLGLICNHPRCFQQKIKAINEGVSHLDDEEGKSASTFPKSLIPHALKELKAPDPNLASLSWKVELLTIILNEAAKAGDKVLVFSQSLLTISYLKNLFQMQKRRVSCLVGDTTISSRQEMTKQFNAGNQEVYLISTKAGGVGLNIHGANRVVIFDFKWNPVAEQQAIGRAYRIGQKKTVFVYTLVVSGTFEEDIQNKHVFKTQLASRVVDKKNPVSWSNRTAMILHSIRNTPAKDLAQFKGKDSILDKLIEYRKDGDTIRSVISTDTFEEEDEDVNLTEIERREVASMVELERLRNKDPEAYQRAKATSEQEEFHRLAHMSQSLGQLPQSSSTGIRLRLNPSGFQSSVNQSLDGSCDIPDMMMPVHQSLTNSLPPTPLESADALRLRHQNQAQVPGAGVAPLPVMGANTYFGRPSYPPPSTTAITTQMRAPIEVHGPVPIPSPPSIMHNTVARTGNLFSLPVSQFKINFQSHLESRIHDLQQRGFLRGLGSSSDPARGLTAAITAKRDEKGYGFVPDDQHWKLLESLLIHDRFVISLVSGSWGVDWVAFANRKDLENRIEIANGLPETEISAQANRRAVAPDPHNLHNIERSMRKEGGQSRNPHAATDMEVMREAADKRRRRNPPLPSWASQALVEEQRRAFPAEGTMESLQDRRAGSKRRGRGWGGRGA